MPIRRIFVNQFRTKEQRKARYCFLRHCCNFNRNATRCLAGWSDEHVYQFLINEGIFK